MVYVIARSHYYGGKSSRWHLCLDEDGELLTFENEEEAEAYIEQCPHLIHLLRREHAREYQLVSYLNRVQIEREKTLVPRPDFNPT